METTITMTAREQRRAWNDGHFADLLAERESITVSREAPRQILRTDGIASPRRRRAPTHRSRRERMPAESVSEPDPGAQTWGDTVISFGEIPLIGDSAADASRTLSPAK